MSKVSVIVPVHDSQKYIETCVNSLLDQTLKDIEIILVENGSSDGSLAECNRVAALDERIRVIHLDKGDVSLARNVGAQEAKGEYIGFVDSDDTVEADMYEVLYGISKENDLDVMYSNSVRIYDDRPPKYKHSESGEILILGVKEALALNFKQVINSSVCTMIARKELFDDIKFPEDMRFEDRATAYRLINASRKVGYIRKSFYRYYQHSDSFIHRPDWKYYYDYAEVDRRRMQFLNESGMFTEEEIRELAQTPADYYIRKLRHLRRLAKTELQKQKTQELVDGLSVIPEGCKLPLKARIIRQIARLIYRK